MEASLRFLELDLEADTDLQEIVATAADIFQAPAAAITFLHQGTQHFKVKKGIDITHQPFTGTFCWHTLNQTEILIIPDTLLDERFANKLVLNGHAATRFYAGIPLITPDGQKIGTLCVFDSVAHVISYAQQQLLKILGTQVIKLMELRIRELALARNEEEIDDQKEFINDAGIRLRSFFESSTNFHVLLGKNGEVIDFNKTAFNFIERVHKAAVKRGNIFVSYIAPEFTSTFIKRYEQALQGEKFVEEGATDYGEHGIIWWDATFDPARNAQDEIIGISYVIRNVTERKLREEKIIQQNRSLLNIAHIQTHEFRGPLSTIMGLMNLIIEEEYKAPITYLKYLEKAIDNLDTKIKSIVQDIENNVVK